MQPHRLACLTFITALLMACASNVRLDELPPVNDTTNTQASTNPATNTAATTPAATQTTPIKAVDVSQTSPSQAIPASLAQRSVYFDFDSYSIKDEYSTLLQAHAKYLSANKQTKIVLEGNTDEVGGREYNLALGQKRALVVLQALRVLGVQDSQMEAVSLGKEKPKALGGTPAAATENRRTDIVYK